MRKAWWYFGNINLTFHWCFLIQKTKHSHDHTWLLFYNVVTKPLPIIQPVFFIENNHGQYIKN